MPDGSRRSPDRRAARARQREARTVPAICQRSGSRKRTERSLESPVVAVETWSGNGRTEVPIRRTNVAQPVPETSAKLVARRGRSCGGHGQFLDSGPAICSLENQKVTSRGSAFDRLIENPRRENHRNRRFTGQAEPAMASIKTTDHVLALEGARAVDPFVAPSDQSPVRLPVLAYPASVAPGGPLQLPAGVRMIETLFAEQLVQNLLASNSPRQLGRLAIDRE